MNNSATVLGSSSSSYYGSEGCECIDVSQTLLSLDDRLCTLSTTIQTTSSSNTNNNTTEDEGILLTVDGPCVPLSFGSNYCAAHDIIDPECMTRGVISPELCNVPFCVMSIQIRVDCLMTECTEVVTLD